MSERRKLPRDDARAVEDESWKKDLERISSLSDEELDHELRAAGIDPERAALVAQEVIEKAAREPPFDPGAMGDVPAGARAARRKRRRRAGGARSWTGWVVPIATVVAALAVLLWLRSLMAHH